MSSEPRPESGEQHKRGERHESGEPQEPSERQELINQAAMEARLHQNAYDRFEDTAAEYFGVNRTAMRCMDVLERAGQLTAGEIARETFLTSGAVTAMLDRLERAGYVQRLRDASDRRRVLVELTAKALQTADQVYGPLVTAIAEFEHYTDAELLLIRDFLRLGSQTLIAHAARIEDQRRHRDSTAATGGTAAAAPGDAAAAGDAAATDSAGRAG